MKSNPFLLLLILGSAALGQTVEDLGIGQPSSFDFPGDARDPLWPIGWTKKVLVDNGPGVVPVEVVPKPGAFQVTSISLDRIPLAVINGSTYGLGDHFIWTAPVQGKEARTFRLQVVSIRDGVVVLRYGSGTAAVELSCPLRILGNQAPKPAR